MIFRVFSFSSTNNLEWIIKSKLKWIKNYRFVKPVNFVSKFLRYEYVIFTTEGLFSTEPYMWTVARCLDSNQTGFLFQRVGLGFGITKITVHSSQLSSRGVHGFGLGLIRPNFRIFTGFEPDLGVKSFLLFGFGLDLNLG